MASSHNPGKSSAWRSMARLAHDLAADPRAVRADTSNWRTKRLPRNSDFADNGAMWRAKYDMPPDEYAKKKWTGCGTQVKPFIWPCTRTFAIASRQQYGDIVPARRPDSRGTLLGNLWAQEWGNLYPGCSLLKQSADPGYDLTAILRERNTDAKQMVRYGEGFFTSLGFAPLPLTFWQRSQSS